MAPEAHLIVIWDLHIGNFIIFKIIGKALVAVLKVPCFLTDRNILNLYLLSISFNAKI
jgi:hypothetical protein